MWARNAVRAVVGRGEVFARDHDARFVPLPAWLVPDGEPVPGPPPPWDDQMSRLHPNDRPAAVAAWWRALAEPGVLHRARVHYSRDGQPWRIIETRYLNLTHQDDVGAILVVHEDLGADEPAEAPPDDAPSAGYEAPVWIVQYLDPLAVVLRTEGHVAEIFGVPAEELDGKIVVDRLHPDDRDAAIAMWLEVIGTPGATRTIRQRIRRPDGSSVWLESTVMNQLDTTGAVVAVSHDVSARVEQEAALQASERELRTLAESVPVAVFRAAGDGTVTFGNARWHELTQDCGPVTSLTQLATPEARPALAARLGALAADGADAIELDVDAPCGRTLRLRCRSLPSGAGVVLLGTVDDVTAEVALAAELRSRAERDELTGLVNRGAFERRLAEALAAGCVDTVLVFVDLDGFKVVNDTWGHRAGDATLAAVADRLRTVVRPGDVVARYGGDEFVLLCGDVGPFGEPAIVERIERCLAEPIVVGAVTWQAAASVGVVRPVPGEDAESALQRADALMYERKRARAAGPAR